MQKQRLKQLRKIGLSCILAGVLLGCTPKEPNAEIVVKLSDADILLELFEPDAFTPDVMAIIENSKQSDSLVFDCLKQQLDSAAFEQFIHKKGYELRDCETENQIREYIYQLLRQSIDALQYRFGYAGIGNAEYTPTSNTTVQFSLYFLNAADSTLAKKLVETKGHFQMWENAKESKKRNRALFDNLLGRERFDYQNISVKKDGAQWLVWVTLNAAEAKDWAKITAANVGQRLLFTMDGIEICSPNVTAPIENGQFSMPFESQQKAEEFAILLKGGCLRAKCYLKSMKWTKLN
ncbi:MAG: hypothetical protein LBR36_04095 [Bacteroidales bacterium]|jgi:hypothetical protein|nr:hypothetical protein [Bacteroidales bacterium]